MFVRLCWRACLGQKLQLITKINKLWTKTCYIIGPRWLYLAPRHLAERQSIPSVANKPIMLSAFTYNPLTISPSFVGGTSPKISGPMSIQPHSTLSAQTSVSSTSTSASAASSSRASPGVNVIKLFTVVSYGFFVIS